MTTPEQQAREMLARISSSSLAELVEPVKVLANLIEERDRLRDAVGRAYGFLWCANDEPGTPHRYPSEIAANEARKILLVLLSKEDRMKYIDAAIKDARGHQC
jgi:hypothetical protein